MIKFSKNFIFGGSMSSVQNDGQGPFEKTITNYDLLFEKDKEVFFGKIGPEKTNDFINTYQDDLKMMNSIGIEGLRHSFSWTKLFPNGKNSLPSHEVVKYYHNLFAKMRKNKMKIFMTLMHFDIPKFIVKEGGLISKTFIEDFFEFSKFIIDEFGKEIDYLATFNEPFVQCSSSYLSNGKYGQWPLENNNQHFLTSVENIILSNAKIVEYCKKISANFKIGIVLDFNPGYERNKNNKNDIEATKYWTSFREQVFLEPILKGEISIYFKEILKDLNLLSILNNQKILKYLKENKVEWLGVNYYTPIWIKESTKKVKQNFFDYFEIWDNPIMLMNKSRGWEIKPEVIVDIANRIKNNYENISWIITENGIAIENEQNDYLFDNLIVDDYRINFFKLHLEKLHFAIEEGANCFGYMMWTPIDSWSFMNGYKNRYGLISLNIETMKKTLKKSAFWWKEMVERRGFDV